MMPSVGEAPSPSAEVSAILKSFWSVPETAPIREVEVVLAFLMPLMAARVKERHIAPEEADRLFTLIDVYLTDHRPGEELSNEAQQLLLEGEHFHHFGEQLGPDLRHVEQLAVAILRRGKAEVDG